MLVAYIIPDDWEENEKEAYKLQEYRNDNDDRKGPLTYISHVIVISQNCLTKTSIKKVRKYLRVNYIGGNDQGSPC
jgi:hypothetical protein